MSKRLLSAVTTDEATCVRCKSRIADHHVFRNVNVRGPGPTTRKVKAYCDACGTGYRLDQVLQSGNWINHGDLEVITDPDKMRDILARVENVDGVTRNEALSA